MSAQTIDAVINELNQEFDKTIQVFKKDLQKVRTGRASTGLVEGIIIDYYGSKTPLGHMGQLSTPEARLIVIQAYDRGAVPIIEKAIQNSGLGLNPSSEGNTIRIIIPALTEENRKDIVKHLNKIAEEMKVSLRNHRRDAIDQLKTLEKDKIIAQDDLKKSTEKIQKLIDAETVKVDQLLEAKVAECMEV
jgi:ribosome recycling factor